MLEYLAWMSVTFCWSSGLLKSKVTITPFFSYTLACGHDKAGCGVEAGAAKRSSKGSAFLLPFSVAFRVLLTVARGSCREVAFLSNGLESVLLSESNSSCLFVSVYSKFLLPIIAWSFSKLVLRLLQSLACLEQKQQWIGLHCVASP